MSLNIKIHNVGHGHAIHIFTPDGKTIVIDLGCGDSFSPLRWLRQRTSTIDLLVITHPHGDHIDEILLLEELGFQVNQINRPVWLTRDDVFKQNQSSFENKLEAYFNLSEKFCHPIAATNDFGDPKNTGGVKVSHFYSHECGRSNINNHSAVTAIEYASSTVVLSGDNEPASWNKLLEDITFQKVLKNMDVFLASHHGRKSGFSSDIFLSKPYLCVVSDGRVVDTDATSRYSYHATGWKVHHRSRKQSETRYCLTTRTDGEIDIKLGVDGAKPYISVTVD